MKKILPENAVLIPDNAKRVFQGIVFDVFHWPQKLYDGSEATFEMLRRPDTTAVIGIVGDKIIVINEAQPNRGTKYSFPGGRIDLADASVLEAAQREMKEETGYAFRSWRLINVYQPQTKTEWFIHLLIAWDPIDQSDTSHDAGEKIAIELLSFEKVKQMVMDREGYLGESGDVFEALKGIDGLLKLPEFQGQEVDR